MKITSLFPGRAGGPILLEQAVYGSFAFWDRGYAFLSHSAGCRAEWLKELSGACQRFGERPPGAAEVVSTLALRLPSGVWAIVQAQPQGADDRGRPGAMAFHAIFVGHRDYARAGGDPFAFAGLFRSTWTAASESEPLGSLRWWPPAAPGLPRAEASDPRVEAIAQAIRRRKRVAIESATPMDDLAREVWMRLPVRARRRASLATWAFGNGNRFDLLAAPRLASAVLDRSYLDPADPRLVLPSSSDDLASPPPDAGPLHVHVPVPEVVDASGPALPAVARPGPSYGLHLAAGAAVVLASLAWMIRPRIEPELPLVPATSGPDSPRPRDAKAPPAITEAHRRPMSERDREAVMETLADLADRLELERGDDRTIEHILKAVVYRGPVLDAASLNDLKARPDDADAARLMEWHTLIASRFLGDRPPPSDLSGGPLSWQLDVALWALHRPASTLPPADRASLLADLLRLDRPPTLTPGLAADPVAVGYAAFLERLGRR